MVVVLDGGGGEKRDGMVTMCDTSDVSTAVLDLATRGRLLLINYNYY
jgi:hypothetical protein